MTSRLSRPLALTLLVCAAIGSPAVNARGAEPGPAPLAHYRFEGRDDPAAELVGPSQSGADSAHPPLGRALRLNGGHLRVPNLGRCDALTMEMWVRLSKPTAEEIGALYASDGWESGFFHFNLKQSGAVELAINGAGALPNTEPETLPVGRWTHLAATYESESGQLRLFVDGRMALDSAVNPHPSVRLVKGSIGSWINGKPSRPVEADIDEFAVYDVALTPAQVRARYLAGKGVALKPIDFAKNVRPILANHCFRCHGPKTQESGLRLDVRDSAMRGGESGEPAIAPYDADGSHLIQLATSKDDESAMPPDGPRLSEPQIAELRNWIDQGAPWPDSLAGSLPPPPKVATEHWSLQPVKPIDPPAIADPFVRTGNPIDAFLFAKLQESGLRPSPAAARRELIRRLLLDLHGLLPTPEEVRAFESDDSPRAWEDLVDRALASPRYGERWASHWLDVIRYGETHGFEVNTPRDNAWPYRDYVIKSLNEDKPYDRFLREQIAGDQSGVDSATGFLVAAPALLPGQVGQDIASKRLARADELHETIVSVGSGVLGLTIGCARCHNHKFDPISQRDYYQMQAMFAGLQYGERPLRTPGEIQLAAADAANANASAPAMPATAKAVFAGRFTTPSPTHRLHRGDPMLRRERVSPDIPAVFGTLSLESTAPEAERRKALADWVASAANPLTPRVIANRLWQHHFGEGLVSTPSDFGAMGAQPSHPELLDWLASALIQHGWSLKRLHRLILTSNAYRQSSRPNPDGLAKDADARKLWRFPPRRLEMEPIRDAILQTSGVLDLKMGGPGFMLFKPNTNYVRVYDPKEDWGPSEWRRMIYAHRVRMARDGVFGAFDCPDAGQPAPRRGRSTTAIQALNLLNSRFIQQQAELLARRAHREAGDDPSAQIRRIFLLAYNREPDGAELADCLAASREFSVAAVCRAVLNSNEFLFLP